MEIRVDGLLDEPDWQRAGRTDAFVQIEPQEGAAATEPTIVHVLFDRTHLYLGVICRDSRGASDLRVRDLRRDFDDTTDDFFGVAIDGVRDRRSALVFRVDARGALRDQATIDGGLSDPDFDAVWSARTTRSEEGWIAEIAIPWRTLRYRAGDAEWGINFQRVIRRKNENVGWSPWPGAGVPYRMDVAGLLTGIVAPPPSRNLRLQPYAVSSVQTSRSRADREVVEGSAGLDLKWAVSPSTIVDLTVNPDFGQTDVDRQVVNLTRFSVFFPERRQFFLENRGILFTGNGQRFEPFFSRRIGLDPEGNPISIRAGARLTTRSARNAFGLLAVSQEGSGAIGDSEFGVVRYTANFAGQNRLGGLLTARADRGGGAVYTHHRGLRSTRGEYRAGGSRAGPGGAGTSLLPSDQMTRSNPCSRGSTGSRESGTERSPRSSNQLTIDRSFHIRNPSTRTASWTAPKARRYNVAVSCRRTGANNPGHVAHRFAPNECEGKETGHC